MQAYEEVMDGIKIYFNRALGTILLYRFERKQYHDIKKKMEGKEMADIYGCEHLLRLFVRLPYLLAQTNVTEAEMVHIQNKLGEFLKFMQKHQSTLFMSDYVPATQEYMMDMGEEDEAEAAAAGAGAGMAAASGGAGGGGGSSSSAAAVAASSS